MPEPTTPAEQQPDTTPDAAARAELEKLPKRELVEQVLAQRDAADRYAARIDELLDQPASRPRARPEDAMVVSALLDLHRTVGAEARQGSTIRGRKAETIAPRYLEAARALGDGLVDAILGPKV